MDGFLGLPVSVPTSFVNYQATVSGPGASVTAQTQGWGVGDTVLTAQLGRDTPEFSHSFHVPGVIPTGRYATGFYPFTGLNRPSLDVSWAFTWFDKTTKLQFNGAIGYMTSWENDATQYRTGDEFHFEWAHWRFRPRRSFGHFHQLR
jgi:hypothetical protein